MSQILYCQTMALPPFDWFKALTEAKKLKSKSSKKLHHRAKNWITCACGNQCASIPRNILGEPLDMELSVLGSCFTAEIKEGKWKRALEVLLLIEKRSAEILKRLHE